jgi:hypothetical protein
MYQLRSIKSTLTALVSVLLLLALVLPSATNAFGLRQGNDDKTTLTALVSVLLLLAVVLPSSTNAFGLRHGNHDLADVEVLDALSIDAKELENETPNWERKLRGLDDVKSSSDAEVLNVLYVESTI